MIIRLNTILSSTSYRHTKFLGLLFPILQLCFWYIPASYAQENDTLYRYIDVTGNAELEVLPDQIILAITIEEYLKEDLDQNTQYRNYHKKVDIAILEQNLITDLKKLCIGRERISQRQSPGQWRNMQYGEDAMQSRVYYINIQNMNERDRIFTTLHTAGITSISTKELKSNNLAEYNKQVMVEALKDAQNKADLLLRSIGAKTGPVISISEIEDTRNTADNRSNEDKHTGMYLFTQTEEKRAINLRFALRVRFRIQ